MSIAGDFLKGDTHGIPNWAWLGIIVGGLGIGYFIRRSTQSSPTVVPPTSPPDTNQTPSPDTNPVPVPSPPPVPQATGDYTIGVGSPPGFSGVSVPANTTLNQIASAHTVSLAQLLAVNLLHGNDLSAYNPSLAGVLNNLQIWIPAGH